MTNSTQTASLALAVDEAIGTVRHYARLRKSPLITGVDVKSVIDDMCITMRTAVDQLPSAIGHTWNLAHDGRSEFTAEVVIDMLEKQK